MSVRLSHSSHYLTQWTQVADFTLVELLGKTLVELLGKTLVKLFGKTLVKLLRVS